MTEFLFKYSLVGPSLDDTLACRHLNWQMNVGDAIGGLEQEIHGHPGPLVKNGKFRMPFGFEAEQSCKQVSN